MFGLEDSPGTGKEKKAKKAESFVFDLEVEVKDLKNHRALSGQIQDKVQKIKTTLRSGADKESFDVLGVVLHGYTSLQKVLNKASKSK